MKVCAIVAVCRKNGIGMNNKLPWRLKNEMAYFTRITTTTVDSSKVNAVVMGRKTWQSIPPKFAPLAGRLNVVLSRCLTEVPEKADLLFASLPSAIASLKANSKVESIFIIGGSQIYEEALKSSVCDRVYITRIDSDFQCDSFFPELDQDKFVEVNDDQVPSEIQEENGIHYKFHVYERKQKNCYHQSL